MGRVMRENEYLLHSHERSPYLFSRRANNSASLVYHLTELV